MILTSIFITQVCVVFLLLICMKDIKNLLKQNSVSENDEKEPYFEFQKKNPNPEKKFRAQTYEERKLK